MKYEHGMQIVYDVLKKGVFVQFRGTHTYLHGPFKSQRDAVAAAEDHCRTLGWSEGEKGNN